MLLRLIGGAAVKGNEPAESGEDDNGGEHGRSSSRRTSPLILDNGAEVVRFRAAAWTPRDLPHVIVSVGTHLSEAPAIHVGVGVADGSESRPYQLPRPLLWREIIEGARAKQIS